jgi:hypothetical protein
MPTDDMENEVEDAEPLDGEEADLAEELTKGEVATEPADTGDPTAIVEAKVPEDIRNRYEIYSYRNAAAILSETRKAEFEDLLAALRAFKITTKMIRTAGGNESDIPKLFTNVLRPLEWHETVVQGDLVVKKTWRAPVGIVARGKKAGKPIIGMKTTTVTREKYLDGHKIDYVKGRVAFDLEWNSKDQTFDRDLYAFSAFFQCGVIDVGVLVTRSESLNSVFRALGDALKRDGVTVDLGKNGRPKQTFQKFGASTTWMGKLLYRLNAGRNGGCPVLVVGITPNCIEDWSPSPEAIPAEPANT